MPEAHSEDVEWARVGVVVSSTWDKDCFAAVSCHIYVWSE